MEPEEIAGLFLVQIHESLDKAHVVEAADMAEEVDEVMTQEVADAAALYRRECEPSVDALPDGSSV